MLLSMIIIAFLLFLATSSLLHLIKLLEISHAA